MTVSGESLPGVGEEPPIVCRRALNRSGDVEWTFYEADREPERRTTRWLTADESVCVAEGDWR